jgi:hypothetical protein
MLAGMLHINAPLRPLPACLQVWDPALIIAQIVSVQCLFYISLGLIQAITIGARAGSRQQAAPPSTLLDGLTPADAC